MQQPTFHKGWSYFFEHPIPEKVPSNKEFDVQAEENSSGQQVIKQNAIGPAPGPVPTPVVDPIIDPILPPKPIKQVCGRGPTMPARSLSNDNYDIKVGGTGATSATSPWPFLVS